MKLTTVTIPAIEMTREEETKLWYDTSLRVVDGKQILDWNTDDGNNEMLLDGEAFYRQVVIKD